MESFKKYIDNLLDEASDIPTMTGQELVDNFRKVHPYSDKDLSVISYNLTGKDTDVLTCTGVIQSESEEFGKYTVNIKFYRDSLEEPFSIKNKCQVFCTCNAFRYNDAYPTLQKGNFYGIPKSNNHIPNKVRNPNKIPTVCKHIYSFLIYLYNKNIIKNS